MPKWKIDPDHSVAAFSVQHMMVANVHGQFNSISGAIELDLSDLARTNMDLEIEVSGIMTGIKKRDDHLKSPDFFDAEKFPKITFKSTRAEVSGFNACKISGGLSIHGVTRPITLDLTLRGPVKGPEEETAMGFYAETALNREDFGITWNVPLENNGFMVGKDIHVSIDIEADLSD